jgi:hypothetical protein
LMLYFISCDLMVQIDKAFSSRSRSEKPLRRSAAAWEGGAWTVGQEVRCAKIGWSDWGAGFSDIFAY